MAAYTVDIAIALKNSNKLIALRKELRGATKEITQFNKEAREQNKVLPVSINSFNKQLSRARKLLDRAAVGTSSFNRAAKALVNVEKEHNNQLTIKEKLLNKIRMEVNDPTFNLRQQRKQQIKENIRQNRALRFSNVNPSRPAVVGDFGQAGGRIGPAQALNNSQGGFLAFSKIANKLDGTNRKNLKQNTKTASLLGQQAARSAFTDMEFGVKGGQIGPATPFTRAEKFGFGKRGQKTGGLFAFPGGKSSRIKGGIGSALIGGGFPALFGAGGISSLLGGLAGGVGGALAPGGGFAASIAATAIAAQIEKTIAFNKAVDDLNVSIKATGGTSLFTSKQVRDFATSLGISKDEALEALKAFKQFEASARISLTKFFGSEAIFDTFAGLKDNASILNALPNLSKELSLEQAKIALETLKTNGASAAELKLREQIFDKNTDILKQKREKGNFFGLSKDINLGDLLDPFRGFELGKEGNIFQRIVNSSTKSVEELKKSRVDEFFDSDKFKQELEDAKERLRIQKEFNEELERQAIIKAPVDELNKLLDPLRQIDSLSKSIGDSFAESFKGIVKGTMTAQEALRNLFQRTADHFLDMAAQILAAQVRAGIMGLFTKGLTGGLFSGGGLAGANNIPFGSVDLGLGERFANGGRPPVGKASLVGERGPELFVPNSAGTIIPNHELGGGTSVVVNVDASGSSVEGDEDRGRELGRLISVAVQSELVQQKRPGGLLA